MPQWLRFFARSIPKSTPIPIGSMSVLTSMDSIKEELSQHRDQLGDQLLQQQLEQEKQILIALENQHHEYLQRRSKIVSNITNRHQEGYNIGGFFWDNQHATLMEDTPAAELETLSGKIDWLKARQYLSDNPSHLYRFS